MVDSFHRKMIEKMYGGGDYAPGRTLGARRMRVMQLMRQDVALSAARGMGRVLSQCAAKDAAHLSRQPAQSPRRRLPSASSLVLERQ